MIASMIAEGTWRGLVSIKAMARQWGYAERTVQDMVPKATLIVRLAMGEGEKGDLFTRLVARVEAIGHVAMDRKRVSLRKGPLVDGKRERIRVEEPDPDVYGAIRAAKLVADLLGFLPQKAKDAEKPKPLAPEGELDVILRQHGWKPPKESEAN